MRVKKFRAKTINEAVAKMKSEFGSEAVVLNTKIIKSRRFFGLFGKKTYEIIGAIDPNSSKTKPLEPLPKKIIKEPEKEIKKEPQEMNQTSSESSDNRREWTNSIQALYQLLVKRDIGHSLALDLIKSVLRAVPKEDWNNLSLLKNQLRQTMNSYFLTNEPWELTNKQKTVVFIGPTGVGKTTTIAKLAANYHLIAKQNVGLITIDTYRIGAVDQLKTYANIIDVPLKVAYSIAELKQAIESFKHQDLILIDTAGRSHSNAMQMAELQSYIKEIDAEVYLVISATTKNQDLISIIDSFKEIRIDHLIITKLDETGSYGVLLQAPAYAEIPIAFVTNGQSVPDDIELADANNLTNLVLGE